MIEPLLHELQILANPIKALQFESYMKNKFPFFGIYQPIRKEAQKKYINEWKRLPAFNKWEVVFSLWEIEEREAQYVALDVLKTFSKKEILESDIELIERLILSKPWWDTVDLIASYSVGQYFLLFPEKQNFYLEKWTQSNHLWLQRTTLIFQLKYKQQTNFEVLKEQIDHLKKIDEFFIQKAIGWSLREYSKTKPEVVRRYLAQMNLSKLAHDQGMKFLEKQKRN
ncbi:MAG: DNA alkylation repair protein [Bacteroidetes bacterium]|nr:DNA alkylation repair protein [Bacteroidota bacterium]